MKVATVIITRNDSFNVKTLHTMLHSNIICMKYGHQHGVYFVKDDPHEIRDSVQKLLKTFERVVFYGYSVHVDDQTIVQMYGPFNNGTQVMVAPSVVPGINWGMFKEKVKSGNTEPDHQKGLDFDTEVGNKVKDSFYSVVKSTPCVWALETKPVKKKCKLPLPLKTSEWISHFKSCGVNVHAYTKAVVTVTHSHECIGNIIQSFGVKAN